MDDHALRCDGCGRDAAGVVWAMASRVPTGRRGKMWGDAMLAATGELDVDWLIPDGRRWRAAHFCGRCAPDPTCVPLWPVECTACTDGPIVVLEAVPMLPGMPVRPLARTRAKAALTKSGWRHQPDTGGWVCSDCNSAPVGHERNVRRPARRPAVQG